MAFHYSGQKIYFMTPVSAAKFRIIKANPKVSFITDNGKVTADARGAMIQGKAKILTIGRTVISILSVGPKIVGFTKKYPGMLTFYARGKGLPDERKLYKYRLIRIDPSKILYWQGYNFGRYIPKSASEADTLGLARDESGFEVAARLLQSSEGDLTSADRVHDWLADLDKTVTEGTLSEEEQRILSGYRLKDSRESLPAPQAAVTEEERKLLKMSKQG